MADQLRWWKLWVSVLTDENLANLPMDDCWRWAMLGVWLRVHGEGGSAISRAPHEALASTFRLTSHGGSYGGRQAMARRVREILTRLPGVIVDEIPEGLRISMRNWRKYQEDSSVQRTQAWRDRQRQRDGQHSVTRDALPASHVTEQTRRDETKSPLPPTGGLSLGSEPRSPEHPSFPAALFRRDCPDSRWRGHCVSTAYLDAHPEARTAGRYPARDATGMPKTCPVHR